jgi:hypothetical protein
LNPCGILPAAAQERQWDARSCPTVGGCDHGVGIPGDPVRAVCPQDVQELIDGLSEDSFEARERASNRLVELPPGADDEILEALRKSGDPEVRWRLQEVMRARRLRHRAARLAKELPSAFAAKYSATLRRAASSDAETQSALVRELDPNSAATSSRETDSMPEDDRRLVLAAIADNSEAAVRRAAVEAMFGPDGELPLAFAEPILRAMDESDPGLCERAILRYRLDDAASRRRPVEPFIRSAKPMLRAAAATSRRARRSSSAPTEAGVKRGGYEPW